MSCVSPPRHRRGAMVKAILVEKVRPPRTISKKGAWLIMPKKARPFPTVPIDQLRWTLDPKSLPFKTTDQLEPLKEIIGQDRAVEAFRFGLGVRKMGYHVFVTGPTGTGRLTTVRKILARDGTQRHYPG